ncbi:hypothetical protein PG988_003740 [Apiospora saccharicola]
MTSQQEYQYEALRSNRHIRLLDIMGGAPNDKVECEMIHNVALDTMKRLDVKYNALSYRWGAPEPATHISINGADFPAVFAFCRRDYWSRVWMIQEIALSRNPTVVCGHMGVAWADFEAFLGSVFAFVAMREPGAMHFWHLTPLLEDSFPLLMDGMRHGIGSPNRDGRWLLSALQKYRSFSATDPRDKIYSLLGLVNAETRRAINVDYDATVERVFTDTFKYLLPTRRRAEAQDDVVTGSAPQLSLNFNLSLDDTPKSPAAATEEEQFMTRKHGPLNSLCCAGHGSSGKGSFPDWAPPGNFPFASWLPNWNDNSRGPTMDDLSHCRFRASADLEPEYSFHEQDRVLEVKGYLVDNLKWLGSSASDFSSSSPTSSGDVLSTDLAIIAAVADSQVDVITSAFQGRPYREADFWKTLVCDSFPTSQFPKAPGEWGSMSVALLRTVAREEEIDEDKSALMASEYLIMLRKTMRGRCFAISRQGMYMMVPEDNALGDCIAVILGCDIPVVLGMREGELVLVGECYVDMLMDGEWLQDMEEEPATIPIR